MTEVDASPVRGPAVPAGGFEDLYEVQYVPMVRLAHVLVDTVEQAEEVVQDAFAAVYLRWSCLDNPGAYLRVAVLNARESNCAGGRFTEAPVPGTPIVVPGDEVDTSLPQGWTYYQLVPNDYLFKIAEEFCTTPEEIAAANGWSAGTNTPIYPGDRIAVPVDAC